MKSKSPRPHDSDPRVPASHDWRGWIVPALVTGAFAVGGAIGGSAIANHGAVAVQRAQSEHDRESERRHAKGSARLLVYEILIAITYTHAMQERGRWLRAGAERVPITIPPDDLRLVASYVTGDEWGELLVAMGDAETVANQMRQRVPPGRLIGRRLGEREVAALAKAEDMMQQGSRALNTLAEAPPP